MTRNTVDIEIYMRFLEIIVKYLISEAMPIILRVMNGNGKKIRLIILVPPVFYT